MAMHRVRSFLVRILNIFRRSRLDRDLREQLETHKEMIKEDLVGKGMKPVDADLAAKRALGNDLLVREFSRDEMLYRWIDHIARDMRYSIRSLSRTPVFTITVVLTLALGIGANTAIFSIVDRLLLRSLPFPNADQLVVIHESHRTAPRMDVSPANWLDWQVDSKAFESFAAWNNRFTATLTGEGEPEQLKAETVSHEFFSLLGVQPSHGRVFTAEDDRPNVPRTVVLSHSLWQRKFAGAPNVIGKTVNLNAAAVEVIGVMPAGFHFLSHDTDVWQPFALDRNQAWRDTAGRFIPYVVGRVRPDVTVDAARTELQTIAARFAELYRFNRETSVTVIPLREAMTGLVRTSILVLFAAVGVLLVIGCSNVANLLLARSAFRRREIAIRTSLGAGRAAILRQLLVESLLLAAAGGSGGIFIARWGIRVLLALAPAELLRMQSVPMDHWVLLYTAVVSVLTGIVVGVIPALSAIRSEAADHLREGNRSVTRSLALRKGLIVAQVAMTVVLLCGAALLVRSLFVLIHDETGLRAQNVLSFRVELPASRYNPDQRVSFFRRLTEQLQSLPGVESASAAWNIPVDNARVAGTGFHISGEPQPEPGQGLSTRVRVTTPGYFKTLGIPLLKGRDFTQDDQIDGAPLVFVVNEAFARKFFPAADPLSASISVNMQRDPNTGRPRNPYSPIVGVVGDVKEGSLRGVAEPTVFYNHRQLSFPGMTLFVRSTRGAEMTREAIQIVREMDRNLPVIEVRMLEAALADGVARDRLNAVVSGAFAACALLLASLGLYGLIAFTVAERTNEIGIRMALGAQAREVWGMVMGEGLTLVAIGGVLGLVVASAVSFVLEGLLFGITAHDPATFAAVIVLLLLVGALAILIPARRATRINPLVALRQD
jgi:putative ABC transport system permease protein